MKKNILVYGMNSTYGGVETILISIINRLDNKYTFDLLLPSDTDFLYLNKIKNPNVSVYSIISFGNNPYKFYKDLKTLIQKRQYDYLWMNISNFSNFLLMMVVKKYSSMKIISHAHGSSLEVKGGYLKKKLIYILHILGKLYATHNIDIFLTCSKKAATWLYGSKIATKALIINNGIETMKYEYNLDIRNKYRDLLNLNSKCVLISVGRLCEVKNLIYSLEVLKILLRTKDNFILLIVGDGEMKGELEEYCKNYKIDKNVKFLGFRDDVANILQAADFLLLPSIHEGLPLTLIEAQCSGIFSIASTGVSEEAKITDNLIFLSLKDSEKWSNSILSKMGYKRMSCVQLVEKNGYDIESSVKLIKNLLG